MQTLTVLHPKATNRISPFPVMCRFSFVHPFRMLWTGLRSVLRLCLPFSFYRPFYRMNQNRSAAKIGRRPDVNPDMKDMRTSSYAIARWLWGPLVFDMQLTFIQAFQIIHRNMWWWLRNEVPYKILHVDWRTIEVNCRGPNDHTLQYFIGTVFLLGHQHSTVQEKEGSYEKEHLH